MCQQQLIKEVVADWTLETTGPKGFGRRQMHLVLSLEPNPWHLYLILRVYSHIANLLPKTNIVAKTPQHVNKPVWTDSQISYEN